MLALYIANPNGPLWTFAIACCVTGLVMIAYAIKILHDGYGAKRG
jgi:hypothetical protein